MAFVRRSSAIAVTMALALIVAACSSSGSTSTTFSGTHPIPNQGGSNEGHTPTSFSGMGTGLFAGDNLNPSFPEGVGVQLYLTFDLPNGLSVGRALITSDALKISGSPFDDLGPLLIEPVTYQSFGPDVFDLPAAGPHTECTRVGQNSVECDVTAALSETIDDGDTSAQFRIRFAKSADSDGQQDLAMFFRTESNTNEAGLFELHISTTP